MSAFREDDREALRRWCFLNAVPFDRGDAVLTLLAAQREAAAQEIDANGILPTGVRASIARKLRALPLVPVVRKERP